MLFRSPLPRRTPAVALLASALALGATACTTTTDTTTVDDTDDGADVALIVRPAEFIGLTPCSAAAGALRSYVATITDVSDPALPFTLPSSLPTPCSLGVRFDNIQAGRSYTLQIDGYEAFAGDIGPTGWSIDATPQNPNDAKYEIDYAALRSGSRHMTDVTGAPVSPRWLGACGEGTGAQAPTVAADTGTTLVSGCSPLVDTAPGSTETGLEVAPQDALGSLVCAGQAASGEPSVASFDLLPQNGLPGLLGIPCLDAPFVQKYTGASLVPGTIVDFFVDAHAEPGGPVTWGATCSAVVEEGLVVRAGCSALTDRGAMRVDIAAVLEQLGVECSGDIAAYDAELTAGETSLAQMGVPCDEDTTFGPLAPGDAAAEVTILAKDGAAIFTLACAASVQAGRTAAADCVLQ